MSKSKFALKRLKQRSANPEVWDAAHDLAEEWQADVNKITFNDANWRVLNEIIPAAVFNADWSTVFDASIDAIKITLKEKKKTAGHPFIATLLYGYFAIIHRMPKPAKISFESGNFLSRLFGKKHQMIVEDQGEVDVPFIEVFETSNIPFTNIYIKTLISNLVEDLSEAKNVFDNYANTPAEISGIEPSRVWNAYLTMISNAENS